MVCQAQYQTPLRGSSELRSLLKKQTLGPYPNILKSNSRLGPSSLYFPRKALFCPSGCPPWPRQTEFLPAQSSQDSGHSSWERPVLSVGEVGAGEKDGFPEERIAKLRPKERVGSEGQGVQGRGKCLCKGSEVKQSESHKGAGSRTICQDLWSPQRPRT